MSGSPLKGTFWLSVSLNIFLGGLVLYYTSTFTKIQGVLLEYSFTEVETEPSFQNATDNYLQFPIDLENATAVFNSVYGVAKEKDSNLNPVGINFFPAYLPPNTMMYHSREDPNIPESFEWIAMDYEFSYSFAHFNRGKSRKNSRPPPPEKPKNPLQPGEPSGPEKPIKPPSRAWDISRKDPPNGEVLNLEESHLEKRVPFGSGPSYLFTFRNKLPLDKLIFLDGASAAKTSTGEMDQQMILSQQEDVEAYVRERTAADRICKWGKSFGLQGVVRLEVGFEIILCDFHRDVELVSNVTLYNVTKLAGFPYENPQPLTELESSRSDLIDRWQSMGSFEWMQAGGNVNDGDDRILIDFSNMVTPLNKTWIDPDPYQRRINKIPQSLKNDILSDLETVLSKGVDPFYKTDWRQITGHVIDKFSPMLIDFNNTLTIFEHARNVDLSSALRNASESLSVSTYNFIRRYTDENTVGESIQRSKAFQWAVEDYVHNTFTIRTESDRLIYSSVYKVVTEVISTIFELYDVSMAILPQFHISPSDAEYNKHKDTLLEENKKLRDLLKTLGWSAFTRCSKTCAWNEVCAVPGWGPGPMGWWSGRRTSLHYEEGSYRVNNELQCIGVNFNVSM
ncbi:hypothetical protein JCM33374_g3954 [Metschnikowia sp. JCM 33374]|nr:hypothetical protein JCM33374_g3954 [Metschnikowia sp. JCM 33374]